MPKATWVDSESRRPDVVGELEHGLAEESEAQLAHLARLADPAAYDAHAARLTAAGESIPDFPIPGEYRPVPVADRLTITLPGGRDSFFDGERRLTLWEQQGIKAQHINAINLYNADPDLYVSLMKSIWRSKERTLDSDVERQAFNMFAFGALTGGAALDTTEGAFALLACADRIGCAAWHPWPEGPSAAHHRQVARALPRQPRPCRHRLPVG